MMPRHIKCCRSLRATRNTRIFFLVGINLGQESILLACARAFCLYILALFIAGQTEFPINLWISFACCIFSFGVHVEIARYFCIGEINY